LEHRGRGLPGVENDLDGGREQGVVVILVGREGGGAF